MFIQRERVFKSNQVQNVQGEMKPRKILGCSGMLKQMLFTIRFHRNLMQKYLNMVRAKLEEIIAMCSKWTNKKYCSKRQLQSLLGSLLYISKCVKASRFYLNRLLDVLRSIEDKKMVPVTREAQRDINWFQKFIPKYNGVTFF